MLLSSYEFLAELVSNDIYHVLFLYLLCLCVFTLYMFKLGH